MIYLEDYIELIEELPDLIRDQSEELRCLDLVVQPELEKLEKTTNMIFEARGRGEINDKVFRDKFHCIRKQYRKIQTQSQSKIEITANMENMMDRYLKKLDQELEKFRHDLDIDNAGSSARLERKAITDLEVQRSNRDKERVTMRATEQEHQIQKEKADQEQLRAALVALQQQVDECQTHLRESGESSKDAEKDNKKELSLEMLLYVSRVPQNSLMLEQQHKDPIFPTNQEIEHAAKIAVLLPYLQEGERDILAKMITQNSQSPLSSWTNESVEQGRQVLENYLLHISRPIKNGFKGPGRPKADATVDDILPEFRAKIQNANTIIERVYQTESEHLNNAVKTQVEDWLNQQKQLQALQEALQKQQAAQAASEQKAASTSKKSSKNLNPATRPLEVDTSHNGSPIKLNSHSLSAPTQIEWISEGDPKNEKKYCLCDNISYGNMIRCDNNNCRCGEWFHYNCVNIKNIPIGNWYCPGCAKLTIGDRSPISSSKCRTKRLSPTPDSKVDASTLPLVSSKLWVNNDHTQFTKNAKKLKLDSEKNS